MRKLIFPCEYEYHENYKELGLEYPYTLTDQDTIDFLGKECYIINGPNSSRSNKYLICKGHFQRSQYGSACFYGHAIDKNGKEGGWCGCDSYFPRYTWNDFLEFLGLPIINKYKLTALTFDNYDEAKTCLDEFLKFRQDKNEKSWEKYINSPEVVQEYNDKIDAIISCLNKISDNTENINAVREVYYNLVKFKLIKLNG